MHLLRFLQIFTTNILVLRTFNIDNNLSELLRNWLRIIASFPVHQ